MNHCINIFDTCCKVSNAYCHGISYVLSNSIHRLLICYTVSPFWPQILHLTFSNVLFNPDLMYIILCACACDAQCSASGSSFKSFLVINIPMNSCIRFFLYPSSFGFIRFNVQCFISAIFLLPITVVLKYMYIPCYVVSSLMPCSYPIIHLPLLLLGTYSLSVSPFLWILPYLVSNLFVILRN